MNRSLLGLLVVLVLLIPAPIAGRPAQRKAAAGGESWPHYGYDDAFTSCNLAESALSADNVTKLQRRWGLGCGQGYKPISRSPAIYNRRLYTTGEVDHLKAYDASNGRLLWEFGEDSPWAPQPVVSEDGVVFYLEESSSTHYDLYAVSGETGQQIWKAPITFDLGYTNGHLLTVDEARGLVYFLETPFMGNGKLYALNKQTGQVEWYMGKATDSVEFKGDYAMLDAGKIYALADAPMASYPNHADHMLRVDAATHAIETTYARPQPEGYYAIKTASLCAGKLVVDYDYSSSKLLAGYNTGAAGIAWQKAFPETTGTIACNPALGRIYVPTDPYLYALDAATGEQVWRYTGFGKIYNPSIANGVIYFISDSNMYAIAETDGRRLASYPLGTSGGETNQVAIAAGMAYFSGNGGMCNLFALGLPQPVYVPMVTR